MRFFGFGSTRNIFFLTHKKFNPILTKVLERENSKKASEWKTNFLHVLEFPLKSFTRASEKFSPLFMQKLFTSISFNHKTFLSRIWESKLRGRWGKSAKGGKKMTNETLFWVCSFPSLLNCLFILFFVLAWHNQSSSQKGNTDWARKLLQGGKNLFQWNFYIWLWKKTKKKKCLNNIFCNHNSVDFSCNSKFKFSHLCSRNINE